MEAAGGRVLLELPGVSIHPRLRPPRRDGALRGRLRLLQGPEDVVLHWEPLEEPGDPPEDTGAPPEEEEEEDEEEIPDPGYEPDWAVLSPPRPRPQPPGWAGGFRVALGELRGLRRSPPGFHRPFVVLLPRGGPCPPPLHLPRGGARELLRLLGPRLRPCPRDPRLLLVTTPQDPAPPQQPPSPGLVTRLLQGPYAAVGGLSRLLGGPRGPVSPPEGAEPEPEPPFEVIACVRLGPRPTPPREGPVTAEEWGRSLDPQSLRRRIFRGGLSPPVRREGWRRLLGLRPWGGAAPPESERRDAYFRMKLQWRSLSPGQRRRNSPLQRYRHRLERDLARRHPDASPAERALLHDILMTYCMFHFDLGYVGGMSEVLAPLVAVAPDEVEAFWGFCSVMEMVGGNFGPGREGLKRQLGQLGQLVRLLHPESGDRLDEGPPRGCCSRWLQLRFAPPFDLGGAQRLCEALWTGLPCPNFLLLLSCVLLEESGGGPPKTPRQPPHSRRPPPGEEEEESDDEEEQPPPPIGCPPQELLSRAEGLFLQLAAAPDVPPSLRELLGLGGPPPSPPQEEPPPESAGDPPKTSP